MIRNRFLITGVALTLSCLVLAGTAWYYIGKESARQRIELEAKLYQASVSASEAVGSAIENVLLEASSQLVGMHEEGLSYQLEKWRKNNPLIHDVFIIDPTNGYNNLITPSNDQNTDWVNTFSLDDERTTIHRHGEGTQFNWNLGYFSENLENTRYLGLLATPIVAWKTKRNGTNTEWIGWHSLNESGLIRGFRLDSTALLEDLNKIISSLTPDGVSIQLTNNLSIIDKTTIPNLPGFALLSTSNADPNLVDSLPLLAQLLIGLCLILALASGFLVVHTSNQKYKDAIRKTNFVSLVSHELKTPLTSISMYAELIDNPTLTEEKRHKFASTIGRQSERLRTMIENLLTMSSLERGNKSNSISSFNLADLVQNVAAELTPSIDSVGMDIRIELNAAKHPIAGDEDSIRRVFINLIDNAAKYARDGKHIDISLYTGHSGTTATVTDHGPGIPAKDSERIFQSFTQLSDKLEDKSPGIGLGLSIARNLMRDQNGDLQLDKNHSNGASFIITFYA